MLQMFRSDIALAIESGSNELTIATDYIERALQAKHRLNQLKEMRAKMFESKKKQKEQNNGSSGKNKTRQSKQLQGQNNNKRK